MPSLGTSRLVEKFLPFLFGWTLLMLVVINGMTGPSFATLLWRGLLLLTALCWALSGRSRAWQFTPIKWAWLYLIWLTATFFWSESPALVWEDIEFRMNMLLLWMIGYDLKLKWHRQNLIPAIWRFACGISLCYGVYQLWVIFPLMSEMATTFQKSMDSVLENRWLIRVQSKEVFGLRLYPNLFGLLATLVFLSNIERAWENRKVISIFLCAFSLVMLILSASKGALLVLLVELVLFLWIKMRSRGLLSTKRTLLCLLVAICCLYFSFSLWYPLLEASMRVRWDYWLSAWAMILDHPFGVGAGQFSQWYPQYMTPDATEVKILHNDHLQVLCEAGWIGLVIHMMLCWSLMKMIWKSASTQQVPEPPPLNPVYNNICWTWLLALFVFVSILPLGIMDIEAWSLVWWGICFAWFWWCSKTAAEDLSVTTKFLLGSAFLLHASIDFPFRDPFLLLFICLLLLPSTPPLSKNSLFDQPIFIILQKWVAWAMVLACLFFMMHSQKLFLWQIDVQEIGTLPEAQWREELNAISDDPRSWEIFLSQLNQRKADAQTGSEEVIWKKEALENLCRLKPRVASFWEQRAFLSSKPLEKRDFLERAVELHPRQPRYSFLLAEQMDSMGLTSEAKKYYQLALTRHEYALSRKNVVWDMELHLLHSEQVNKAISKL